MRINTAARVDDVRALAVAIGSGIVLGAGVGGAYIVGAKARSVSPTPFAAGGPSQASALVTQTRGPQAGYVSASIRSTAAQSAGASALQKVATSALQARLDGPARPAGGDGRCLTQAVYYEARGESPAGQAAVAQVVLNRVRHPAYPKTICGVVFQRTAEGCQFSFACNGALDEGVDLQAWRRAQTVAAHALAGAVMSDVRGALMFQAASLSAAGRGVLAGGAREVAQIGAHIFYRNPAQGAAGPASHQTIQVADRGAPTRLIYATFTAGPGAAGAVAVTPAPAPPKIVLASPTQPLIALAPPVQTPAVQTQPVLPPIDLEKPAVSEPS